MDALIIQQLCLSPDNSIRQAMSCIDLNGRGIALLVDQNGRLIGTITDGDVRRAMLAGIGLDTAVSVLLERKQQPVTALIGTSSETLLQLMREHTIYQIPLLDPAGCVVGLVTLGELLPPSRPPLQAVVMAGGFGMRLRPLTEDLPKPMLPVGDRPIIEHIVARLCAAGIRQMSIATHYKSETIVQHLGNGQKFGVNISYVHEERPLGTAGALGLMTPWETTLLVINGDILTSLNYALMMAFHQENQAVMTVAVRQYDFQVPYGVVEMDGIDIRRLSEKPRLQFFVNAGVYLLEPSVYQYIPTQQKFDMTELITRVVAENQRVVSFPVSEYWLDIGQHADYEKVQADFRLEGPG